MNRRYKAVARSLFLFWGSMTLGSPPTMAQQSALTLEQVLDVARQRAPVVLAARARIEEARGRYQGAAVRFRENPVFETEAGRRTRGGSKSADIDVAFSQDFEPGGRRQARIAGAQASIDLETASSHDVLRRLLRDAATTFYRALAAQQRELLLRASDEIASEFLITAQRRFEAGEIPILEVNLAKTSAARVRAAVRAAEAESEAALGELRSLLGSRPEEALAIRGELRPRRSYDAGQLFAQAKDRPDIRVLESDIREAEADVRLGEGFRRPEIGLGTRYKREEGANVYQGGLKITLPVFSHGQELRAVGTARARRVRGELEALLRAIAIEVKSAHETYLSRIRAVQELENNALPSLDENETLARRSYEEGELGLVELLLIRREILETRLFYLDRLTDAAIAAVEVEFRSGVLK